MKKLFSLSALAVAFVLGGAARSADEKDIVDTAVGAKNFDTLVAAVKAAGLADTLKGTGPFTVFAPTDEAFKKLGDDAVQGLLKDQEKLKKVLLAHVVVGKAVMAADAKAMNGKEVNGFKIDTDDGVRIGNARVTKADVKCSNGVIHVIDTVLMPVGR